MLVANPAVVAEYWPAADKHGIYKPRWLSTWLHCHC